MTVATLEVLMSPVSVRAWRNLQKLLGLTTVISWALALWQAAPRLMAGPLCTAAQDPLGLAGPHCPACIVAVLSSLALVIALMAPPARRAAASPAH